MRRFRVAIAAIALATLVLASSARAAVKPLAVTSVSPQNGAVLVLPPQVTFEFKTDQALEPTARTEIATQPTPGQDGTLANEFTVDTVYMTRGDAFPDTYTGSTNPAMRWQQTPGTYYFQFHFTHIEDAPPPVYVELNTYVSP